MGIKIVRTELEAKLIAVDESMQETKGKLEQKSYSDNERLKISVKGLICPDGTNASVLADGIEISNFVIIRGKGKVDIESKNGFSIPNLELGQQIEISIDGNVILKGVLVKD